MGTLGSGCQPGQQCCLEGLVAKLDSEGWAGMGRRRV